MIKRLFTWQKNVQQLVSAYYLNAFKVKDISGLKKKIQILKLEYM